MKILLILFAVLASTFSMGQSDFDERLLSKFSQERIEELSADHPSVIAYWTFYLDNSYEIVDAPMEKDLSQIPQISIKKQDEFNILNYDIHMSGSNNQLFKIKGTDKLLVLYSNDKFTKLLNEELNKSNSGS